MPYGYTSLNLDLAPGSWKDEGEAMQYVEISLPASPNLFHFGTHRIGQYIGFTESALPRTVDRPAGNRQGDIDPSLGSPKAALPLFKLEMRSKARREAYNSNRGAYVTSGSYPGLSSLCFNFADCPFASFFANLRGGDVTPDEETEFLRIRAECVPPVTNAKTDPACDRAIQRENEYHESIESYKTVSWFNIPQKPKKRKDVRRGKRLTRETNHTLRNLNEVGCFGRAKLVPDEYEVYELGLRHFVDLCISHTWQIREPFTDKDRHKPQSAAHAFGRGSVLHLLAVLLHLYAAPDIPQLIEQLDNSDPAVRNSATRRFGKSAEDAVSRGAMEPGIPTIIKLLGDWESCQSAAEVFYKLAPHSVFHEAMKHGIPHIIKLLNNSHSEVRQSGVNAFRELAAHRKENPTFHEAIKPGIPQIIELLEDSVRTVRRSCANAFGELATHPVFHGAMKPGIPEIIKLLDNGDWEVRRSSANAFSELAAHSVFRESLKLGIPQIIKLLDDWQPSSTKL
ncbi:armadillo-type protein [Mycena leptocephala]|nr:armadillo-type protein [Mycena leptocephala]